MEGTVVVFVMAVVTVGFCATGLAADVECPDPGMPEGGMRRGPSRSSYTPGSKLSFDCPDGFERVGSPVSVCNEDGEWSLPLPQCIADCSDIEAPLNGAMSVSTARKYGSVARFQCNPGYSLVGAAVITCKGGQWNRPVPSCFADCPAVQSPTNSVSRGGNGHGDVMYFRCAIGFQLIGPSMVTCVDGNWSEEYPRCV